MFFKRFLSLMLSISLIYIAQSARSQANVDVDLFTGAPVVNIPIHTINFGNISIPIALVYSNNGIKVDDFNQYYGLGWNLRGEVSISRRVRGFPDDIEFQGHSSYSLIKGWLRTTTIPTAVENFSIANDNTASTCADEVSDYSYMNTNTPDNYDTEPDIFTVTLPDQSFDFVFDKNGDIKTIPYVDVDITKTVDGNGKITSFTIKTDDGNVYLFDIVATTSEYIEDIITPSTLPAFRRDYIFYRRQSSYGSVIYNSTWYVNTITDLKKNVITYSYNSGEDMPILRASQTKELIKYNSGSYTKQYLYTHNTIVQIRTINTITSFAADEDVYVSEVTFTWDNSVSTEKRLSSIKAHKTGTVTNFVYTDRFNRIYNQSGSGSRYWLKQVVMNKNNCESIGDFKLNIMM